MLGNVAMFVANRAAGGAVGSLTRWAGWIAVGALFATLALVFAVVAIFWAIEPRFGPVQSAGIVGAGCLAFALVCLATPAVLDALEKNAAARAQAKAGPVATAVDTVAKETEAAVDYFGPLQVIASAFIVGMRTGSQVRALRR